MSAPRLPLTVVSGYLGAGKTTLINRLLTEDHGTRLVVLVNDFGAINIDAGMLVSASDDTIALTNGCVCCTMGADLFMALADVLDRAPRPDRLVIEASGISDPARIANAARAEPELEYSGIVTVADLDALPGLLGDELIAPQVRQQIACADLVMTRGAGEDSALASLTKGQICRSEEVGALAPLLLGMEAGAREPAAAHLHADYSGWDATGGNVPDRAALDRLIARRPPGLYRLKGRVRTEADGSFDVQVVGPRVFLRRAEGGGPTRLVGLGLASRVSRAEAEAWWSGRQATNA